MPANNCAHLDESGAAIVIENLTVRDKDVAREAQRWTTGKRGRIVDDPETLANADLSEFVSEALKIGAHALSATGQAQDARRSEQMFDDVTRADPSPRRPTRQRSPARSSGRRLRRSPRRLTTLSRRSLGSTYGRGRSSPRR